MQVRRVTRGDAPLLISIPHVGTHIPPEIAARMTAPALLVPDTDWHLDKLYDFAAGMGASVLTATHSRYVIDLNRDPADTDLYPGQFKTGLCPLETFAREKIYQDGAEPDAAEKQSRTAAFWKPYHDTLQEELARIKARHGYAILYDSHSICSQVPALFEGKLPDLNLGSARGASCAAEMADAALAAAQGGPYSAVLNGRFVGGHITRHYGQPKDNIHAIQMELVWDGYMRAEAYPYAYDEDKAAALKVTLRKILQALLAFRP